MVPYMGSADNQNWTHGKGPWKGGGKGFPPPDWNLKASYMFVLLVVLRDFGYIQIWARFGILDAWKL
jgi:hypothetical protein